MSRLAVAAAALVLGPAVLFSQQAPQPTPSAAGAASLTADARWLRAVDAWDAGAYPAALDDLRALMHSADAPAYLDRVALLTGELFTTTDVTSDGRNPRIAGDVVSYETGPAQAVVTRIVRPGTAAPIAEIRATNVVLNAAGTRAAWVRTATGSPSGEIVVRDLAAGAESVAVAGTPNLTGLTWAGDGRALWFIGADPADPSRSEIYSVAVSDTAPALAAGAPASRRTDLPGIKSNLIVHPTGAALIFTSAAPAAGRGAGGRGAGAEAGGGQGRGRAGGGAGAQYVVYTVATKATRTIAGTALTVSADGSTLAWLARDAETTSLLMSPTLGDQTTTVRTGRERLDAPALAPDGKRVAYQLMSNTDWEIYISDAAGTHTRVTRDIQHDVLPRFLDQTTLLGLMGEPRHRRSQIYDLTTGTRRRIFANNTVRTISPEYAWVPSADGKRLVVRADRDGDTISAERGVYVVDLTRKVSAADLLARLERQLSVETDLRTRMAAAFKPLDATIRSMLARASLSRVYEHEKTLFDFDSKYVSQPGNRKAIEYLERAYRSFGYAPTLQEFTPPQARGKSTANVVAIKKGTVSPELIYVVSSHFDSEVGSAGADDDTSGTAALLETSRLLADVPLPTTIVFASFTGEEAGLLGSSEFVRLAVADKWHVIGALNNDMIGWAAESARMDNTIRYSNAGIKDIQHGAAFQYTNLITYDAKYYRGTDAGAFYEAWGDIVAGIGSYPVLANPNYHQPTDLLETMNFRQILETAKVTAATLVYLSSSPSRLNDVKAATAGTGVEVTWTASPEKDIRQYVVAYGPGHDPLRTRQTVTTPRAVLPAMPAGSVISVKAVNVRGLEGWDWARIVLQ